MTRAMSAVSDTRYVSADGWSMQRENGKTPNGNEYNGMWVLRNAEGDYIDHNKYRFDLEARHDLDLRLGRDQSWQTESFDGFTGTSNIP